MVEATAMTAEAPQQGQVASTSSTPTASSSSPSSSGPAIDQLVLDAGPLLAQLPLRGLAKKYYVPPSVMLELKDKHARDHLEFLRISGMDLEVREAGPEALARVIEFAKQTGDYAVLSRPDLSVLALAYALEVERHGTWRIRSKLGGKTGQQEHEAQRLAEAKKIDPESSVRAEPTATPVEAGQTTETAAGDSGGEEEEELENDGGEAADEEEIAAAIARLDLERAQPESQDSSHRADLGESTSTSEAAPQQASTSRRSSTSSSKSQDDEEGWTTVPSSSRHRQEEIAADYGGSDGEGEWVTSDNILTQKHRDLGLVTDEAMTAMRGEPAPSHPGKRGGGKKGKGKGKSRMTVATMTADYAVQNVLLQMGMALVSTEGLRIDKVRSWVLRCHACFKICKDSEKKFCPSCGNPTLIRTSVTSAAPVSSSSATTNNGLQLHLKKNFQFRTRGTKTSLPLPKAGSTTSLKDPRNANLILREDQPEWQRALNQERIRKQKEQKALERQLEKGKDTLSARYEDPDWLPGLLSGGGGKEMGGLPDVGFGRRNNNQAKHGRRRK
ncbi:hypothetical protein BCV69DRAFT_284270 [Microstroma glucosiphilum]|uniref:20S-pre-rRNA D-site endonuclease NOB1 n=1 Tax=Pseudomicrostroma glucosiphilum TaxID=1684307 RepID=A0A316U817_9BASI|nr:hypothetical protein BCV69DRAFT_284270 [Pseudomicrostroma glucosiphilum]PWN19115.1 hypothetical protein BCV69DRAFT_284270 [Pseudomicrostroma glucosiphilum]